MRILLYGGSFDPPHYGHLNNLRAAAARVCPDRVVVMPAGVSPFKHGTSAPGPLRVEMCGCFAELAREMGFLPVENSRPDLGLSHTIALGMAHMQDMDAVLFQVSDQPLLRRDSVEQLVEVYRSHPDRLVALGHDGVRGNPCLFPASLFPELLALEGDHGGSAVIRRHEDRLLLVEASPRELTDVDTPQALEVLTGEKTV